MRDLNVDSSVIFQEKAAIDEMMSILVMTSK